MSLRQVAVHEAAHAVVAAHFGGRVVAVEVGRTRGATYHEGVTEQRHLAAVTAAGEVGQQMDGTPFVDLSCGDLAAFERAHGFELLARAQRDAREVLEARRDAWLTLAVRLERERVVEYRR